MKRAREEDKLAGPLFPRLHVNDADKGGPRAPPRNKMALYEQFSIPPSDSPRALPPHCRFPLTMGAAWSLPSPRARSLVRTEWWVKMPREAAHQDPQLRSVHRGRGQRWLPKTCYQDRRCSETSMADSVAGANISPDNVAGVIGPKHFWKARRAIINQQRVFALQVFELHKLMKVQKLLAASPQLLLEDPSSFHGSSTLMASAKDKPADSSVKGGQKPFPREEEVGRRRRTNPPGSTATMATGRRRTTAATAAAAEKPPPASCTEMGRRLLPLQLLRANQAHGFSNFPGTSGWFRPSPRLPPAAAFMAPPPVYGGDFTSSPYLGGAVPPGFMAAPYGLPPATPSVSGSMVDQAGSFHWRRHLEQRPLTSSNRSNKRSELQSSTASSAAGGTPPLPPAITPVVDPSRGLARVIKVVPHNPKSASESAVRIFQSIQKERQHYDPL
ncbi:unnamed protein product [Spirodela intermedia]|uniref:Protein EARLY FLOWERING 3 n=1 Tax=Spirodela intermedia TaxID=51605 RepID=A0A7I8ISG8_SPIIN|nr:unnamed protein product [Spirodela intermedia]CAA6660942.1 unnamed protein product [Spirodela intermedia]